MNINIIKKQKMVGTCNTHANMWEALEVFEQCIRRLLIDKKLFQPCYWNSRNVFFLLGRCMALLVGQ